MKWALWLEVARQGAAGSLAAIGLHEEAVQVTSVPPCGAAMTLAAVWARCWPKGSHDPSRPSLDARAAIFWAGSMLSAAANHDEIEAQAARKAMETYAGRLGVKVAQRPRMK